MIFDNDDFEITSAIHRAAAAPMNKAKANWETRSKRGSQLAVRDGLDDFNLGILKLNKKIIQAGIVFRTAVGVRADRAGPDRWCQWYIFMTLQPTTHTRV